ncbi:hypothetical protein [Salinisphaera sp. LB1]|uniref:hypothetical protein n=1 Tax=Salinisphaera sp. LB1 TaxID=2183911 RepID=UPI000D70737D|nr:hypothetical protein [Salinisphaera sp. LB1]AWN15827.1 hypothetical protein SALB1_1629 [Salinisphaera sp. LB1]
MDSILSLINDYRIIIGAILVALLTIVAIHRWWETVSLWWLQVTCSLPLIGKNAVYARRSGFDSQTQWFHGEKNLCEAYAPHYSKSDLSPEFFDHCKSYLRKAREIGRNTLPLAGWAGLAVMVFLEAMGFSYVLAGWTIPGASEQLKQQGAVGIALLISTILVFLTHSTGHELHHNSLIKKVNAWWESVDGRHKQPNTHVSLEHDSVDDDDESWRHLLSRIPHNANVTPSYKLTIATVIAIVLIGTGATYVRGQVLEQQLAAQHRLDNAGSSYGDSGDPYANAAPQELKNAQRKVDTQVDNAVDSAERKGGWMTFAVLAVIFTFLQFIGIVVGYKTGFAGYESKAARRFIGRFKTREEFANYYQRKRDRIVRLADKNLGQVQSKMAARPGIDRDKKRHLDNPGGRHFLAYMQGRATAGTTEASAFASPAPEARDAGPAPRVPQDVAPADQVEQAVLDEQEIQAWMERLGWDRERTVERLLQARHEKQARSAERAPVSEEEAARLIAEQFGRN